MSDPTICEAIRSAISSQALADGLTLSDQPAGTTLDLFGQDLAPANPSPSPASKKASTTPVTSGLFGENSSASAILQSSLESRLRALLNGSDLCEVTWKRWDAPWGQCLSKPRARVRTIFGTDTGSWPTPTTRDHKDGSYCPNVPVNGLLGRMVWPTPTSLAPARNGQNEAGNSAGLVAIRKHAMAMWQTPVADDAVDRAKGKVNSRGEPKLSGQAIQTATWPTPCVVEPETPPEVVIARKERLSESTGTHRGPALPLGSMVQTMSGSSVPMEKPGGLNPDFVCWLMGYPAEWVSCAVSETPLIRGRQRRSSKQPTTP